MREEAYILLQALVKALLEFEREALEEVGGKEIMALIEDGRWTEKALIDLYILSLLECVERGCDSQNYAPVANIAFLIDYVNSRPKLKRLIRRIIRDLMGSARDS